MRGDDGRKLDHQTLETLRLRAVGQVARGVPAAEVGAGLAVLGLPRRTIYPWLARSAPRGVRRCRPRRCPGGQHKLADEQVRELAALIAETAPVITGLPWRCGPGRSSGG